VFPQTFPVSSYFPCLWLHLPLLSVIIQAPHSSPITACLQYKGSLPPVQILSLVDRLDTTSRQRGFHHDDLYASVSRFSVNNWDYTVHWVLSVNVQVMVPTLLKSKLVEIVQAQALGSRLRLLSGLHPISSVHHNAPCHGRVRSERFGRAERHNQAFLSNDFVKGFRDPRYALHPCKSFLDQIRTHFRTGMIF